MPPLRYLHFLGSKLPILMHTNGQGIDYTGQGQQEPGILGGYARSYL